MGLQQDDDGEVAYGDQGLSIVVQRNLKVSYVVDEENWVRKNVFIPSALYMGGYAC